MVHRRVSVLSAQPAVSRTRIGCTSPHTRPHKRNGLANHLTPPLFFSGRYGMLKSKKLLETDPCMMGFPEEAACSSPFAITDYSVSLPPLSLPLSFFPAYISAFRLPALPFSACLAFYLLLSLFLSSPHSSTLSPLSSSLHPPPADCGLGSRAGAQRLWRGRGVGAPVRARAPAQDAPHPRLRPQPHGRRPPLGHPVRVTTVSPFLPLLCIPFPAIFSLLSVLFPARLFASLRRSPSVSVLLHSRCTAAVAQLP